MLQQLNSSSAGTIDNESNNITVPNGEGGCELATGSQQNILETAKSKVMFEIFGEELLEKTVLLCGKNGRLYLPPAWIGHNVNIIRID